jgi:hypothetical protein
MDLILTNLNSSDKSSQLSSLNSLSSFFPLTESQLYEVVNSFKNHLKKPDIEIVSKILPLITQLLSHSLISPILTLIPDLIHLLKFRKYQTHSFLMSFFAEVVRKTGDLKIVCKNLCESGISRKSEELKLATLRLACDLAYSGIDLTDMKTFLESLAQDLSINVQNASAELIKIINDSGQRVPFEIKGDLAFGCVPAKVVERLWSSNSWKEKCDLLEILKETLESLEDFSLISSNISDLITLLSKTIQDPHSQLTKQIVEILQLLTSKSKLSEPKEIFTILPPLLLKFSDTKISIRQSIHKLIREFLILNTSEVMYSLTKTLDHSNWHIREESVMMLIFSMLSYSQSFDFMTTIEKLAKLLDDSRTKIRAVSTEALAVLGHIYGQGVVLERLSEIVDGEALKCLHERFSVNTLPMITEDYVILSKEIPMDVRMISSPYLMTTPLDSVEINERNERLEGPDGRLKVMSTSYENVKSQTPTTAETYSTRTSRKGFLTKTSRSVISIHKSSSNSSNPPSNFSEPNPIYIPFEELEKLPHPSEALQKATFHTEVWFEQFEIINTIRKLAKHNPEVFISKVTLHGFVVNLVKWADSLRSSLSKNSLIAIKELCLSLGKVLDSEIIEVMKILLKKAADTNSFLAETADEGLTAVCKNLTELKVLNFLVIYAEQNRNPSIKAKVLTCLTILIEKTGKNMQKFSDLGKLIQFLDESQSDASAEVRSNAKQAYSLLLESISDEGIIDLVSAPGLKYSTFKKVKEQFKKKLKSHSISSSLISKKELRVTLPSLSNFKSKKLVTKSARDLIAVLSKPETEPEELLKLVKLEQDILNNDWKIRYDSITSCLELAQSSKKTLKDLGKLESFFMIIEKGSKDANLKVRLHSLSYLSKLIPIFKTEIEPFLRLLMESVVSALGCSNTSIRESGCDVCILLGLHTSPDVLVPLLCENISKSGAKGKALVLNIIVNQAPGMKNKSFLEVELLNLAYKFIDDSRLDVRNEASRILIFLYKTIGNSVFESTPTKKLTRVISVISST